MVSRAIQDVVRWAAEDLEDLFAERQELQHLLVRKRGDSLALVSGTGDSEQKHARLTCIDGTLWGLSFPRSNGSWEPAPFTGSVTELIDMLVQSFPAYLTRY